MDPDRAPDPNEPARLLVAEVPRLRGRTPYTTVGDLFAYASALFTAAALAAALRAGRAAPRGRSDDPEGPTAMAGPTNERIAELARRLEALRGSL